MTSKFNVKHLTNQELVDGLKELVGKNNQLTAEIVAHIAEVDARKLYLDAACSSMHRYCVEILHLSDYAAFKRIAVARAARTYTAILEMLARGDVHLTGVTLLTQYLTLDNHRELLAAATHKSKRQIEQMLAERFPQPDVASSMRKLPAPKLAPPPRAQPDALRASTQSVVQLPAQSETQRSLLGGISPKKAPAVVAPIAPERFKVQFTASRSLYDKLCQAQALLRHQVPDGDLADVCERAVDLLLDDLVKKKFGKGKRCKKSRAQQRPGSRHIPASVRRQVAERDGGRCTFVDSEGVRCGEMGFIEFHHHGRPFGKGGAHTAENITLFCRGHNGHAAVRDYGAAHIDRRQRDGKRKRRERGGLESVRTTSRGPRATALP